MKQIILTKTEHNIKPGDVCSVIEPNIKEDALFIEDGKPIGFYLSNLPDNMAKIANLANKEFMSKNVPKTLNRRISEQKHNFKTNWSGETLRPGCAQYSCILGGVQPNYLVKRVYKSVSSVHRNPKAQTFIKAMLELSQHAEALIKDILPEQYTTQFELIKKVPEQYRFGNLFTSSISNSNISVAYHQDNGNIKNTVNVIICKKWNSSGGDLNIPDYNATVGQADNSMLVYPVWKNLHGVTPIKIRHSGGYRNSLVFYPLKAFVEQQDGNSSYGS